MLCEYAEAHPEIPFKDYSTDFEFTRNHTMEFLIYFISFFKQTKTTFKILKYIAKIKSLSKFSTIFVRLLYIVKKLYYELRASNTQCICRVSPWLAKVVTYALPRKYPRP